MKKFGSKALLFAFALFAFSNASAQENKIETQEKKISEAEFKAIQKKSADKTNGQSYRLKRSSKTYKRANNSLSRFFNETTEYMPPDSSRSVIENGGADGKTNFTEIIKIGQKAYNRTNNGTWNESATSANTQAATEVAVEHIFKGKVEINKQIADLYESKYVAKTTKGGRDFVTTTISKSWFGKDGVLLRTEEEIETNNTITKRISEYEYDPNIKVQAPTK